MRIVILDGHTANPGDLSWDALRRLGDLTVHERTAPADVVRRAQGAEAVLTNKVVIDEGVLSRLPGLRYVGVLATGHNVVDDASARRRGVVVTNIPAYSTMSVAQMVTAHLLHITSHVAEHARAVREGAWRSCPDFCFWLTPLTELDGLTMGIAGLGHTGMATARVARALGMRMMALSSKDAAALAREGIRKASDCDQLFRESDVVSLHCPLTPATRHMADARRIGLMKPTAILINTARGPLVDEQALADALNAGRIRAAGLDVLGEEPPAEGSPLLGAANCHITPHIAWATRAARRRLIETAAANLRAFMEGRPVNTVTPSEPQGGPQNAPRKDTAGTM